MIYICPQGHLSGVNTDDGCPTCGWQLEEVSDALPFNFPEQKNHRPVTPKRIQRKRTKGWRKPENTVNVGRPSKWGNPCSLQDAYKIAADELLSMEEGKNKEASNDHWVGLANSIVIQEYKAHLERNPDLVKEAKEVLRGKNLMCWCKVGDPCHGDVLLEIANA